MEYTHCMYVFNVSQLSLNGPSIAESKRKRSQVAIHATPRGIKRCRGISRTKRVYRRAYAARRETRDDNMV